MKRGLIRKILTLRSLIAPLFIGWLAITTALAQDQPKSEKKTSKETQAATQIENKQANSQTVSPDIEIKASVTAKELKFEVVGDATVEFTGSVKRDTYSNADRQNLPRPVEPGVTYRDIGIRLLITSLFDIERIVSDALKQGRVNQDEIQKQNESSKPPSNTSPLSTGAEARKPGGRKQQ